MHLMRLLRRTALFLAAATVGVCGAQGAYPSRPIRVVVPYPAGGAADAVTRALADRLSSSLGVPLVVENKPGAGSIIGTESVIQAPPDGYTWLIASGPSNTANMALRSGMRHDFLRDLVPVAQFGVALNYFVVPATSPASSLRDYVAMAKTQAGKLHYGSGGAGSSQQFGFELLKDESGINVQPVHYKGAPPILTDLASGQLSASFLPAIVTVGQARTGRLKVLALAHDKRSKELPDVPTMAEAGYPKAVVSPWLAVMMPVRTDRAIVARVEKEIHQAVVAPELTTRFEGAGAVVSFLSSADSLKMMQSEIESWRALGKATGLKLD